MHVPEDTGDEVTLLADGGTLGSARELGVPHAALEGDIRGALQTKTGIASVVAGKTSFAVKSGDTHRFSCLYELG